MLCSKERSRALLKGDPSFIGLTRDFKMGTTEVRGPNRAGRTLGGTVGSGRPVLLSVMISSRRTLPVIPPKTKVDRVVNRCELRGSIVWVYGRCRVVSALMRSGPNILREVTKLFGEENFGVSDVAINMTRMRKLSHVMVAIGTSRRNLRRIAGRLGGLISIIGVGSVAGATITERLYLVGIGIPSRGTETRVVRCASVFETGVISIARRALVVRLAKGVEGVGTFVSLVGKCKVGGVSEANLATVTENMWGRCVEGYFEEWWRVYEGL